MMMAILILIGITLIPALELRASIDCAREIRGTYSMAKLVTPRAARRTAS